ncbi:MAG: WD40 repeat domain-containing protein, partial [Gemmataceae bacterium]
LLGALGVCAAVDSADIDKLIEQLGDDDLAKRRAASKRLEGIGAPALEKLRDAEKKHSDPDVKLRAGLIVRAIENKGWGEVRTIVGPTRGYWLNRIAFTPDGKQAVVAGGAVIVYDLKTGKEVRRVLERRGAREGLALSKDGKLCLTGHVSDRTVRLLEFATGKEVKAFAGNRGGVQGVALSADGSRAVSCGSDCTLRLWDVNSGKELYQRGPFVQTLGCVAFSADGKYLLCADKGPPRPRMPAFQVWLWDAAAGKEIRRCKGHTNTVTAVAFAPDGRRFLSASLDGTVRQWDTGNGKELRRFTHEGGVRDLALSADGKRLVTGGEDRTVRVWSLADGAELHRSTGHKDRVLGVALSRDGRQALSCDADNTIRLWRLPP